MPLIERDDGLSALRDLFTGCTQRAARIAIVSGTTGIGKSALLQEFIEYAEEAGALVMTATAARTERALGHGVLDQLFRSTEMPPDLGDEVLRLLDALEVGAPSPKSGTDVMASAPLRGLWRVLRHLTDRQPVVLAIDDVHHIDDKSQHGLLYLIRRLRSARLMVVMGERGDLWQERSPLLSEVLCLPGSRRLYLEPLSESGVRTLLADRMGEDFARRFGPAVHSISAGNPMFVHALLQDQDAPDTRSPTAPEAASGERPKVGQNYGRAVLRCLERAAPPVVAIARGTAVLGEESSPRLLADLLDLTPTAVSQGIAALTDLGLLEGGRFRHPAAATAVIDGLTSEECTALHTRAVHLLRQEGAPPVVLARHLVAANRVEETWAVPVLEEAAREALAHGRLEAATSCLRLAERIGGWPRRPALLAALAEVEWRTSPSSAVRYLPELGRAVQEGDLSWSSAVFTLASLLWHGRVDQAREVLAVLTEHSGGNAFPVGGEAGFTTCLLLLTRLYPELTTQISDVREAARSCQPRAAGGDEVTTSVFQLEIMAALADALVSGDGGRAVAGAEAVLQSPRVDEALMVPFGICLVVLACDGSVDRAADCADLLLQEHEVRHRSSWYALMLAVRAMISLRKGELTAAVDRADQALALLPAKDWGVVIGLPLSVLITALTALGGHERLPELLRVPVPETMFRTSIGCLYLYARGIYQLSTGRAYAALGDFELCGRLMGQWNVDHPTFVPWRSEAARACLALGDPGRARTLAEEQLSMLDGPHGARSRGLSLCVLAKASDDPRERRRLLRRAVENLQSSGDRFELARAIFELSEVSHELGDNSEARSLAQRAGRLFEWCGAGPLAPPAVWEASGSGNGSPAGNGRARNGRARRNGARSTGPRKPTGHAATGRIAELSAAEQRVAALAAQGHSNRQISDMLYITISTVEQHLTRVYRKLNVNDRLDLPPEIQFQE